MEVSNLTKKAFSLGKKFSALKNEVSKLKSQQQLFYTSNSTISAEKAGHWETDSFGKQLDEIDDMAKSSKLHEHFAQETEDKLKSFEGELTNRKIDFYMLLMQNGCCQHNLKIEKVKVKM